MVGCLDSRSARLPQGRTIDEARRRVREALGLFIEDDAESAEFVDDLPA